MNKKIKFICFSFLIIFSIFLTSCRYDVFWEEKDLIIGETKNYIVSQNLEGEYYISGFTNEGLSAKLLTIPSSVSIDDKSYKISYVDDIFKYHSYVRTLLIDIPTDKININGCHSIRVVQVSQENLVNADTFLEGLNNIDIYVINSLYKYEDGVFGDNTIHYDSAPKIGLFDSLTIYEYVSLGVLAIGIIIAAISFAALVIFIKSESLYKHNYISAIACCASLVIYVLVTVVLTLFSLENIIYLKGTLFLLPVSFLIISIVAKDSLEDDLCKLNIAFIIISVISIIINLIFVESIDLIWAEILAITFIVISSALIKFLYDRVNFLFVFLVIITLAVIPISVFLCDLLINYLLNDLYRTIIGGGILLIIIAISIIVIIKIIKNFSKNKFVNSIPLPKFNGIFSCKIYLPYNFHWVGKPTVNIKDDIIYFSGTIISEKVFSTEDKAKEEWCKCQKEMADSIYLILDGYYLKYPNAKEYRLNCDNVIFRFNTK